jgi:hypothetical protein
MEIPNTDISMYVGEFRTSGVCVTIHHATISCIILHTHKKLDISINNLKLGAQ